MDADDTLDLDPGDDDGDLVSDDSDLTDGEVPADEATGSPVGRRRGALLLTTSALAFVFVALMTPNDLSRTTSGTFTRIPLELLLGAALVLTLPARLGRVLAALAGLGLGVLAILKIIDTGSYAVIARPFNLVLDWAFLPDGLEFLITSFGRVGAIALAIGIVLLVLAVPVLMMLSMLRLSGVVRRHDRTATGTVAVLGVVWVTCAALGAQIVPGQPIAAKNAAALTVKRAGQLHRDLQDREVFAKEAAVDRFRDTPGDQLLTGLRGKDVVLTFVESYGRDAVQDPEFAPQVDKVLSSGTAKLKAAGFSSRSGFLTSPTAGGGSVLAHATLLSGLWINNRQRYKNLTASDRLTLNRAFQRADWRSVGVMPGITHAWAEGGFFGYDAIYAEKDLGYRGPKFSWATMTDQYVMSAFERKEHGKPGHAPMFAEIPLVSSHIPWSPVPSLIDWDDVGDGSIYHQQLDTGTAASNVWRDKTRIRAEYRRSIEYSLNTVISYVETYGDDNLVMVFLGDHQPVELVTGKDPSRDVPITIVARDPAVLDRISGWGWTDGLKPAPKAPVWKMSDFRDRFLTAFGPQDSTTSR